jgi:DNA-binding MarR family transcriptional regulator
VRTDFRLKGPLFESPAFVLMQSGALAMQWAARTLEAFGLSVREYAALQVVRSDGGISQDVVGARLGLSKATTCRLATRLERRHLIDRRQHILNPARRALYITSTGAELLAEAAQGFATVDVRFRKCLGDEALRALAELPPRELTPIEFALRAAGWD